jgi:hypothetical protein
LIIFSDPEIVDLIWKRKRNETDDRKIPLLPGLRSNNISRVRGDVFYLESWCLHDAKNSAAFAFDLY